LGFAIVTIAFAAFASKPTDTFGALLYALIFIVLFFSTFRLFIRMVDRYQIVRSLSSIWNAIDNQNRANPPSTDLLYSLDWLRGSLIIYVRSSLGYYSGSDLHIPQLRREMDLSFGHVTELLHRSAWIPSPIFLENPEIVSSSFQPAAAYDFLLAWIDEISRHVLADRRRTGLFENRILALSYLFHDSVSFFERTQPAIAKEVGDLITEKIVTEQSRRRSVQSTMIQIILAIITVSGTLIAAFLSGGLKL